MVKNDNIVDNNKIICDGDVCKIVESTDEEPLELTTQQMNNMNINEDESGLNIKPISELESNQKGTIINVNLSNQENNVEKEDENCEVVNEEENSLQNKINEPNKNKKKKKKNKKK